jgi:hypothetical protein
MGTRYADDAGGGMMRVLPVDDELLAQRLQGPGNAKGAA